MRKLKLIGSAIVLFATTVFMSACLDGDVTSEYDQLIKEVQVINSYLSDNPPAAGSMVLKDPSGITLVFSEIGTGLIPPNQNNELIIEYKGSYLDGRVFDPGEDPLYIWLADPAFSVINGWKIALSSMTEGAKAKVYIPSFYGYGKSGSGNIPGNATLVFDIYLQSVEPTDSQEAQLISQTGAIDAKLEGNELVTNLENGVRIIHTQIGTGNKPGLYDQVTISYTGKLLSNESVFLPTQTGAPVNGLGSHVVNYLHGLSIGLRDMQVGGKATIYLPAMLGYGATSSQGIPANSNLIFEVELLSIVE